MRGHVYSAAVGVLGGLAAVGATAQWGLPWLLDPTRSVPGWDPERPAGAGLVGAPACLSCHPGQRAAHEAGGAASTDFTAGPEKDGWRVAVTVGSGRRRQASLAVGPEGEWVRADAERTPSGPAGPGDHYAVDGAPKGPGRRMDPPHVVRCLHCHATIGDAPHDRPDLTAYLPGVQCEACHGAGRGHLDRLRASGGHDSRPPRAGGADPVDRVRSCGRCHGNPEQVPVQPALADAASLADTPAFGLLMSACFASEQGPECAACHDPHAPDAVSADAARLVCLSCHAVGGPRTRKTCLDAPDGPCLTCHMPKAPAGGVANRPEYTDHWIRLRDRDPKPASVTTDPEVHRRARRLSAVLEEAAAHAGGGREKGLVLLRLATARGMAGDGEGAEAAGRDAVALMPTEPFAHYNLGNIFMSRGAGKSDEAIDTFKRALFLSPDHVMARVQISEVYRRMGHFQEAEDELAEATRVRPDAAVAWLKLGEVRLNQGKTEGAVEALGNAVKARADYPKARYALATALGKAGRSQEQLEHLAWLCEDAGPGSTHCAAAEIVRAKVATAGPARGTGP